MDWAALALVLLAGIKRLAKREELTLLQIR